MNPKPVAIAVVLLTIPFLAEAKKTKEKVIHLQFTPAGERLSPNTQDGSRDVRYAVQAAAAG